MPEFTLAELEAAAALVREVVPPTPQYAWPPLTRRAGCEVWVKHENHTPTGAFKIRGGVLYMHELKRAQPDVTGVVSATRGNHGQSIALAARRVGLRSVILVPHGNSVEKNAAMEGFGAELIVHGRDFDEARVRAAAIAEERGLHFVPSFHPHLVRGVATYALELFRAVAALDVVYVPVGMGSGLCGLIAVRDLLGLGTEIVGVVADRAPAVKLSFEAGRPVATESARTFADGVACRDPHPGALEIIRAGAARIVSLGEDEIAAAIRIYFSDTHNVAEGAGAAPLAALLKERSRLSGKKAAVILCGGNIDAPVFRRVLGGETPDA
ncbi:MAG: threonine dehydratase [Hyphomicrobiaceae bacterium]|nr:threonine dehydratase [Hyphomicrobiaceae bacterium]